MIFLLEIEMAFHSGKAKTDVLRRSNNVRRGKND
jgi:hypothetical protein